MARVTGEALREMARNHGLWCPDCDAIIAWGTNLRMEELAHRSVFDHHRTQTFWLTEGDDVGVVVQKLWRETG